MFLYSNSEDSDLDVILQQPQKECQQTKDTSLKYKEEVATKGLLDQKNAIIQQLTKQIADERAEYILEKSILTKQIIINVSNVATFNYKMEKLTKEKQELEDLRQYETKTLQRKNELLTKENVSNIATYKECIKRQTETFMTLSNKYNEINKEKNKLINTVKLYKLTESDHDIKINILKQQIAQSKKQHQREINVLTWQNSEYLQIISTHKKSVKLEKCINKKLHQEKVELIKTVNTTQFERDEMEKKALILRESSEFIFLWKWKDNKNQWTAYDHKINKKINKLSLKASLIYKSEKNDYNYSITKTSKKCGFQLNLKTKKKREIKRDKQAIDALIEEKEHLLEKTEDIGFIVQWQWNDGTTKAKWISYPKEIHTKLEELAIDTSFNYNKYKIYKVTKDTALQINVQTKMQRACRRYRKKIETLLKEAEQKDNEYGDLQQKIAYKVVWEWYYALTQMWIQCKKNENDQLEQLSVNEEVDFRGNDSYLYKLKRLTKDTAKQWIVYDNNKRHSIEWSFRRIEKASGFNQIEYPEWWHYVHARALKTTFIGYTAPNLLSLGSYMGLEGLPIRNLFNKTAGSDFEILDIDGVKNEMLWDKYQNEKKSLIKAIGVENINERYLFHGSQTLSTLDNILTQGFRPEFNKRGAYGKGVYFAKNAIYSTKYAAKYFNSYEMLCCKVMTGESTTGQKKYDLTNWPKKSNGQIFDSLVDSLLDPSIFAIHESCRAYPLYVIRYKNSI